MVHKLFLSVLDGAINNHSPKHTRTQMHIHLPATYDTGVGSSLCVFFTLFLPCKYYCLTKHWGRSTWIC